MNDSGGDGGAQRPAPSSGSDPAPSRPLREPARPLREVAAAIVIRGARVLVQRRPEGKSWCGWWEFPGGKFEPGEDARACAERECIEELALSVRAGESLHEVTWESASASVHVCFVLCETIGDAQRGPTAADRSAGDALPAVRAMDGQELRWATADELRTLEFLPANASLLPLLEARLRGSVPG